MTNKLYIGNLPFTANEEFLRQLISKYGTATSVAVIIDRDTGRSKGFGFVEMSTNEEAAACIENLNGTEHDEKVLKVSLARPKEERPRQSRW